MVEVTLTQRVGELVVRHGSLSRVARALEIDKGYLSRLWGGSKKQPSEKVLRKLGLIRVVKFVRRTSTASVTKG